MKRVCYLEDPICVEMNKQTSAESSFIVIILNTEFDQNILLSLRTLG